MESLKVDYDSLTAYDSDESAGGTGSVKVYDSASWYTTVRLSDIPGAELIEVEDGDTGQPRNGIFIPFRNSGLTVTPRKNVLLVCKAQVAQVASPRYTHLLTQVMDNATVAELRRLGFNPSFIGHMRPTNTPKPKRNKKY